MYVSQLRRLSSPEIRIGRLLFLLAFQLPVIAATAQPPKIELEDLFRNPEYDGFQVSPGGTHVSFLHPYESRMNIHVREIGSDRTTRLTADVTRDITTYQWKGDRRLVYLQDSGGDQLYHLHSVDRETGETRDLTPFEGVQVLAIVDGMAEHPTDLLISMNRRDPESYDVYRLDVATGDISMTARDPGGVIDWYTDHDHRVRIGIALHERTVVLHRETEDEPFTEQLALDPPNSFFPQFFTSDNENLIALSNAGRDKYALVEYDLANGREVKVIYERSDVDLEEANYSKRRKVLTNIWYATWKYQRETPDPRTDHIYSKLESSFPDSNVWQVSSDLAENKFIFRVFGDRSSGAYYLYDVEADRITKLADSMPWLDSSHLAEMKPISYQSRDGLTIHGYLTLPAGRDAQNLPVVANPHGGPFTRDFWTFSPQVQLFANRGYAVLQMNYRGSTGYGKAFEAASYRQWGRKMQDDVTDGVKWLIDRGIADPDRICIYGASYGGYAALAGVTFTPDLYVCAIDYAGISNIFTWMEGFPPFVPNEWWYERAGHPEKDAELLRAVSPFFHVDQIEVPMLIAQGANDPQVRQEESDQIVEALRERGIDVEYILKEDEGHGFMKEENRLELYRAMERFLAEHLDGAGVK
jgi:dipeptidyl aminopeptidase/acylaminoacyl peptidase